jgi:adhesin transport system outer membrane protein
MMRIFWRFCLRPAVLWAFLLILLVALWAPVLARCEPLTQAPAVPAPELDPATAVALALAHRPEIQGAQALIARRQAELQTAQSAWWPMLRYSLNPGYGGTDASDVGAGNQGSRYSSLRGSAGLEQKLYDFGATPARIAAARSQTQAAQADSEDTAEQIASDTLAAYMQAAAAQEQLAVAREQIQAMQAVLGRIEQRVRAGLSGASDRSAARVSLQRAQLEAQKADTASGAAMSTLLSYIGVWPERLTPLARSAQLFCASSAAQPDFEQAPSIRAALSAAQAAQAARDEARASQYPSIGVGVSRTQSSSSHDGAYNATWVGLVLQGSVSLGGEAQARLAAAQAQHAAAERDLDAKRLDARTRYAVAQLQSAGARARLDELQGIAALARQTRDLYWQEYTLDKQSLANVLGAERDIYLAQWDAVQALSEAIGADIAALAAAGRLTGFLAGEGERAAVVEKAGDVVHPAVVADKAEGAVQPAALVDNAYGVVHPTGRNRPYTFQTGGIVRRLTVPTSD